MRWAGFLLFCAIAAVAGETPAELAQAVADPDTTVRLAAVQKLGRLGPGAAPAVEALVDAAYDETREVKLAALRALAAVGPAAGAAVPPLEELLGADRILDRFLRKALVAIGKGPRPALLRHLKSKANTLAELGAAERKAVVKALKSKDGRIRGQAAFVLRRIAAHDDSLLPAYVRALDHPRQYARRQVHGTIRALGHKAVPALLEELAHKEVRRRRLGALGLASYSMARHAVSKLAQVMAALDDEDRIVRRYAVMAIGQMRQQGAKAVPRLLTMLEEEPDLRHDVLAAFCLMRQVETVPAIARYIASDDPGLRGRACGTLRYFGPLAEQAVPALVPACFDEEWALVNSAMQVLGQIGAKAAPAAPYIAELSDAYVMARGFAQQVLKQIGAGAPLPPMPKPDDAAALVEQLAHVDTEAAGRAAFQLGRLAPKEGPALPALRRAMESRLPYVRRHAALALARIGQPAMPLLVDALEKGTPRARRQAIQMLMQLAPLSKSPPVDALLAALEDDDGFVRRFAASAVGAVGPRAERGVPQLVRLVQGEDRQVGAAAIFALGRMGTAAGVAVPVLAARLADWENQTQAAWILGVLGDIGPAAEPVIPAMVDCVREDSNLASNALPALVKLGPAGHVAIVSLVRDGGDARAFAIETLLRHGLNPPGFRAALDVAMQAKDVRTRQAALQALAHVPAEGEFNVQALVRSLLREGEQYYRSYIPHTLAKGARPDQLIVFLKHKQTAARWCAWRALSLMEAGKFTDAHRKRLEPLMLEAIGTEEDRVRTETAVLYRHVPPTRVSEALLRAMAQSALQSSWPTIAAAIVALPDPALAQVIAAVSHKDSTVRRGAAAVVRAYGPRARAAIPALRGAMKEDAKERTHYLRAILAMREHALPVLLDVLKERNRRDRYTLVEGIKAIGESALTFLRRAMAAGDVAQRRQVVALLGEFGAKALPDLLAAARDTDPVVRRYVYQRFGRMPERAELTIPLLAEGLAGEDTASVASSALKRLGPKAAPALKAAAASANPAVRAAAIQALPGLGEQAIPLLAKALKDPDAKVRASAAGAAGSLRAKAVPLISALRQALKDEDENVRRRAAAAFGWIGKPALIVLPDLVDLFRYGTTGDRSALGRVFERIGAPAVPHLVKLLGSKDRAVAERTVGVLASIGTLAAEPVARAMALGNKRVRELAGEALRRMRGPAVKPLMGLLAHESRDIRIAAAWRLGQMGRTSAPAVPALIALLEDSENFVVSQAVWTLGEIGPAAKASLPAIEKLLEAGRHVAVVRDAKKKIRG